MKVRSDPFRLRTDGRIRYYMIPNIKGNLELRIWFLSQVDTRHGYALWVNEKFLIVDIAYQTYNIIFWMFVFFMSNFDVINV